MENSDERPVIRPEDIEARSIRRRTFLGRFGAAVGVVGLVGFTAGCEPTDSCDDDQGDSISSDEDGTDEPVADNDFADACDSDAFS